MRVEYTALFISLAFGLAGCATTHERHPDFGQNCETLVEAGDNPNVDCVRVFYGTNREVLTDVPIESSTEVDIDEINPRNSEQLHLGRADVWLPRLIEKGGARERGETPMLTGDIPKDEAKLADYVFLTRITSSGKDRFLTDMQTAADEFGEGSVLLFVHGFNVQFESALIRSAQLAVDLAQDDIFNPGVPALFSWPSAGRLTGYKKDRATSLASAEHLTEFLNILTRDLEIDRINIIAHSMGNRVLTKAIEDYAEAFLIEEDTPDVEFRIILAAADVDRDVFNQVTGVLDTLDPNVTIYTSDGDRALVASEIINRATRLGYTDGDRPYIRENPAYQTVDATDVATELFGLGHSYYSDNPFVLGDMLCTLLETDPEDRALTRNFYESDPSNPEFFKVTTDIQPTFPECSLTRETVPAAPESAVAERTPVSRAYTTVPPPPPPPPPPAPPPPPLSESAPLPIIVTEMLFYESGEIYPIDRSLDEYLSTTLSDISPSQIFIDAYTDTVGSDEANKELSAARAKVVADWYIARGIEPETIIVTAHGETDPPVATEDNVPLLDNRQVFIRLIY